MLKSSYLYPFLSLDAQSCRGCRCCYATWVGAACTGSAHTLPCFRSQDATVMNNDGCALAISSPRRVIAAPCPSSPCFAGTELMSTLSKAHDSQPKRRVECFLLLQHRRNTQVWSLSVIRFMLSCPSYTFSIPLMPRCRSRSKINMN